MQTAAKRQGSEPEAVQPLRLGGPVYQYYPRGRQACLLELLVDTDMHPMASSGRDIGDQVDPGVPCR
eukprot:3917260-Rhodomonas_salina.3